MYTPPQGSLGDLYLTPTLDGEYHVNVYFEQVAVVAATDSTDLEQHQGGEPLTSGDWDGIRRHRGWPSGNRPSEQAAASGSRFEISGSI